MVAVFLALIAAVGPAGYLLPMASARRHEPPRLPVWGPWVRAITGWVCVCLGVGMGLTVGRVNEPAFIAAVIAFLVVAGVMEALWARDAARHLR
jgi:hypothetical protein